MDQRLGRPLGLGDFIEIKTFEQRGIMVHEVWLMARIVDIGKTSYGCQFLKKDLCLRVPFDQQGVIWR